MLFGRRKRHVTRILIVEDEPLVAFDNEMSLLAEGYKIVATVDNLADASAVLDTQAVDLVLTDVTLTGAGDGTDVARHAAARGIPVLFVSGSCPVEAQRLAIGCLIKPYNDRSLKAALDYIDRSLTGDKLGKLPAGLSFYGLGDRDV